MTSLRDSLRLSLEALDDASKVMSRLADGVKDQSMSDEDGINFLQVKNTLMISYLIDMTRLLHHWSSIQNLSVITGDDTISSSVKQSIERLQEMRIIFDRIRPLEKKMRYQIDKVLALSTSTFAVVDTDTHKLDDKKDLSQSKDIDPLSYRPNPDNMILDDDDENSEDDDSDKEVAMLRKKSVTVTKSSGNPIAERTLYKPPRVSAVLFHEKERAEQKEARMKKTAMEKMKQSELLQTMKAQYSDKPEEDDLRGGANMGKQREAARRFAERAAEKDRYEEENFIRLGTSRKEKKLREKIMRNEFSNLRVISDVGDLASGVSTAFQSNKKPKRAFNDNDDDDGFHESKQDTKRRQTRPKNQFQEALYGTTGNSKKDRKNKSKR